MNTKIKEISYIKYLGLIISNKRRCNVNGYQIKDK